MRLNTVKILGVAINSTRYSEVLNHVADFMAGSKLKTPLLVFTPNPEFLVEATRDLSFRELLNRSDINLPDGIGLIWASKFLGTPILERVSGADVVEELLETGNKLWVVGCESGRKGEGGGNKWTVGIAGARRGVQEEASELIKRLREKYSSITFINIDSLNYQLPITNYQTTPKYKIQNTKYNVVFAAHGMKKQEQWIWENKNRLKANVMMGVGGSLDFLTGFTKRSPLWIRGLGMEWLWRGLQRPKHFLRVWKAVFVFGFMMGKEIIKKRLSYKFNN